MDRLWQRLVEIYGASFSNQYGDVGGDGYETWLKGLADITPESIAIGLESVIKSNSSYPPNLPTFRTKCMDLERYGIPTPEAAHREACCARSPFIDFEWSHPVVYHAGSEASFFDLRRETVGAKKRFFEAYEKFVKLAISGTLPPIPTAPALPSKKHSKATPEQREKRRLERIAMVGF